MWLDPGPFEDGRVWYHRDMGLSLDHLVILVVDLDGAVRDYNASGFAVAPGGEHADGLTRNALVSFRDGTYLELIAFIDPDDPRDNLWNWRSFLDSGGGLIDHCLASDDFLSADVRRLRETGLVVDGPSEGGRTLPDGTRIRWSSASIRQRGRALPFLIQDTTPRGFRVPTAAAHPNGASGITELQIQAGPEEIEAYAALTEVRDVTETLRLGACTLRFTPHVESRPGPTSAVLGSESEGGTSDYARLLGAGLRFA